MAWQSFNRTKCPSCGRHVYRDVDKDADVVQPLRHVWSGLVACDPADAQVPA